MESTQTQYRLMSVKDKTYRAEKRTTSYIPSKKSKSRQLETQQPPKSSHNYSKKPPQKQKEYAKYQNYGPKTVYYPVHKPSESQNNGAYYPGYKYYPQYYVPSPMGYPELLMPVYGYPVCYTEKSYNEKKATEENSPQELGNSGCPTVASEEELNNLNGEECEFKVMCNGNLIHTECFNEPGSDPNASTVLSSSDYDDFVLPFTGSEPKSEAISLPSFLTE